jgi:hypothetical protein
MLRICSFTFLRLSLLLLLAFDAVSSELNEKKASQAPAEPVPSIKDELDKLKPTTFETIDWDDLMPEEDLNALMNPPNYLDQIEDSAFENQTIDQIQSQLTASIDDRYQQALVSKNIIKAMDGRAIRIPGFVVPLEFDEETITEFFLVPYFGACIHSPPPPPNQIIYVHAPNGLELNTLYDPFWISGKLSTKLVENYMATAAYSMQMQSYEDYTE